MTPIGSKLIDDLYDLAQRKRPLLERVVTQSSGLDQWLFTAAALRSCDPTSINRLNAIFHALGDELLDSPSSNDLRHWRGAFGFLCFQCAAEGKETASLERANEILRDANVQEFIDVNYGVDPQYHPRSYTLHRTGTTSYILKGRADNADYAIKILKPWYLTQPKIAESTNDYRERYGGIAQRDPLIAPTVYHSSMTCIIMKFVEGSTLGEAIDSNSLRTIKQRFEVLTLLLKAMRTCAVNEITHCDLSPENIILTSNSHHRKEFDEDDEEEFQPTLIDFGFNYVLLERTGGAAELTRKERYLSDEVVQHPEKAGVLSDICSLGILFIDVLLGTEDRSDNRGIGHDLDRLWRKFPEMAPLIEDMIDKDPRNRLLGLSQKESVAGQGWAGGITCQYAERLYVYLIKELKNAGKLHLDLSSKKSSVPGTFFYALAQLFGNPLWDKLFEEFRRFKISRDISLLTWASIATFLHAVTSSFFAFYTYRDFTEGTWQENFPGRLVAVTFSAVASQYYVRVMGSLNAKDVDLKTNISIRSTAVFPWVPILYALIVNPKFWPYSAAAGVLLVAVNNRICWRMADKAISEGKQIFRLPASSSLDHFLLRVRSWWTTMFAYAVCLFVIGILLQWHYAKDEWAYAMVVAIIINIFILFWQCCVLESPSIIGGLQRSLVMLRRAQQRAANQVPVRLNTLA